MILLLDFIVPAYAAFFAPSARCAWARIMLASAEGDIAWLPMSPPANDNQKWPWQR